MKIDFCMDIDPVSVVLAHTPAESLGIPLYHYRCGYFFANRGYYTVREGLDEYLLMVTISGRGFLEYRGEKYDLEQGDAVLIHCLEYQRYGTAGEKWEFYWLHFGGPAANAYHKIINEPSSQPVKLDEKSCVYWFREIFGIIKNPIINADLMLCSRLVQLLTEMASAKLSPMNHPSYSRHREEVEMIVGHIKERIKEPLTLDELSMKTHLSKYYLIRLFKAYTGRTPHEYLIYHRVSEAKRLLTTTDASVGEIALELGFHDSNHFISCFKKATGATPMQYRRMWPA